MYSLHSIYVYIRTFTAFYSHAPWKSAFGSLAGNCHHRPHPWMSEQPEPQALQTADARWIQSRSFRLLANSVSLWEVARELETKEAEISISARADTLAVFCSQLWASLPFEHPLAGPKLPPRKKGPKGQGRQPAGDPERSELRHAVKTENIL